MELVKEIVKRFSISVMSLGFISGKVHITLVIVMSRLGSHLIQVLMIGMQNAIKN